jgi:hypothetical protein
VPWEEIAWRFSISDDGTRIAHIGWWDALATWDSDGQLLAGPLNLDLSSGLDLSPDGRLLAVGIADRVNIFDTDTLEIVSSLPVAWSSGLQFSPDGATLAVSSQGPTRIYQVGSWTYYGFEQSATALDLSGDGSLMATLDRDGSIRLWTTETEPRLLHTLPLVRPDVLAINDGRLGHLQLISDKHVATADQGRLRVLTLDADELLAAALLRVNRDLTPSECDRFDILCDSAQVGGGHLRSRGADHSPTAQPDVAPRVRPRLSWRRATRKSTTVGSATRIDAAATTL